MARALYNEIDPYAAQWLRNLIAAGHIAPGDVDERSIDELAAADLRGYTQVHFFAGIGVWSYALRLAGWPDDRPVWTGSCPCQPFSAAGKGAGFADERHLWPAFHHLIRECRPPVVFGEQVASKDGLAWLDLVQADLEGTGYASAAVDLCAAGVGAPHIRQRLYWVADNNDGREGLVRVGGASVVVRETDDAPFGLRRRSANGRMDDPKSERSEVRVNVHGELPRQGFDEGRDISGVADAELPPQSRQRPVGGQTLRNEDADRSPRSGLVGRLDADAGSSGLFQGQDAVAASGLADADQQQQHGIGNAGPRGRGEFADGCGAGWPRPTNGHWRDADWLFCRDGKWRPVEPGTFPLAHGATDRVGRLRAYGNAIVPQVAQAFIGAYLSC